jgi:hypothetical protein
MEPESEAEQLLIDDLYACTNGDQTETLIINNTPVIWVLDQPRGIHWTNTLSSDPTVGVFRETTRAYQGGLPIEPDQSALVHAPPTQTHLRLDPGMEATWLVVQRGVAALQAKIDVTSPDLTTILTQGKSEREALVNCARTGWEIGNSLAEEGTTQPGLVQTAFAQLTGSGTACVTSLRKAQQEAATAEEAERLLTASDFTVSHALPREVRTGQAALTEGIRGLAAVAR